MIRTTTWHYRALQGTYAGELPENREVSVAMNAAIKSMGTELDMMWWYDVVV